MLSNRLIRKFAQAGLILLLIALSGCAKNKRIVLYPIEQTDFYVRENGDVCMSEYYFNEVLQAELEKR